MSGCVLTPTITELKEVRSFIYQLRRSDCTQPTVPKITKLVMTMNKPERKPIDMEELFSNTQRIWNKENLAQTIAVDLPRLVQCMKIIDNRTKTHDMLRTSLASKSTSLIRLGVFLINFKPY